MAMDIDKLAKALHESQGLPGDPSKEMKGMADAIISEMKTMGIVSMLPGTVMGTATPEGGALKNGSAGPGLILGPSGPTLAAQMVSKMGKGGSTPQMIGYAAGITTHVLTGKVMFAGGKITGVCGNSPASPGPVSGSGSKGKIVGLSAGGMAQLVVLGIGQTQVTDTVKKMCEAIVNHLQDDAEVSFMMGGILGTAPSGGGPIAGSGAGGKIS